MKNLTCMYTNADTLTNQMPKLKSYLEHQNPQIIAVTNSCAKGRTEEIQQLYLP